MRSFKLLGGLLTLVLLFWCVGLLFFDYTHWKPDPQVLGLGDAFEGSDQLPKETIEAGINAARERMHTLSTQGRWFALAGDLCAWLSFACTAAVTLIAGWFGRTTAAGAAPDTSGLPGGATRAVGLLAGLAAVLTAGGSLAANHAHGRYDKAVQAQNIINQSTKDVQTAPNAREAQSVLDNLKLKIAQL